MLVAIEVHGVGWLLHDAVAGGGGVGADGGVGEYQDAVEYGSSSNDGDDVVAAADVGVGDGFVVLYGALI